MQCAKPSCKYRVKQPTSPPKADVTAGSGASSLTSEQQQVSAVGLVPAAPEQLRYPATHLSPPPRPGRPGPRYTNLFRAGGRCNEPTQVKCPYLLHPVPRAGLGWACFETRRLLCCRYKQYFRARYILCIINVDIYSSLIDDTIDKVWLKFSFVSKVDGCRTGLQIFNLISVR